MLILACEA